MAWEAWISRSASGNPRHIFVIRVRRGSSGLAIHLILWTFSADVKVLVKKALYWLPIAAGIVFLLALAYLQRGRALSGQNDYVSFYVGGKLAGTDSLYSRPANESAIRFILGFTMDNVTFVRPPFYAALHKPLSVLPYLTAYAVFSLAMLSCVIWFVIRFSKECPALPFIAAMSIPILGALCDGQDTLFLVAMIGVAIMLFRAGRDFAAGLVIALCAIKFHLFLFIPLALLIRGRWRVIAGGATGVAGLTALGTFVCGVDSMRQFLTTIRDPWINASATIMPNLHGMVAVFGGGAVVEAGLIAIVVAAFVWLAWRVHNLEILLAASLIAGLLTSFHSGVPDDVLLLPAFVLLTVNCAESRLRVLTGLVLTPVPYFLVLADAPFNVFLPLALLGLFAMICLNAVRGATTENGPKPSPAATEAYSTSC